ncbi:MAG TPA: type II secretion system protein [Candidatus Paceibacterota bacterium]
MKKLSRGFTLIELLVVIAIIGILSSIVLASLNTARAKGADAAVKSNLSNSRAQAEILYDTNGCYSNNATCNGALVTGTACNAADTIFANTNIAAQLNAAESAGGGTAVCNSAANRTAWAAGTALKSTNVVSPTSGTDFWCVDSTGASKELDVNITTQTACP